MKMSVVYFSKSGNTAKMADIVAEGMRMEEGIEAKAFSLDEVDEDFLKESKCVIFGTPIYLATMCDAMSVWLNGAGAKYGFAGKIGGAFATADYLHGGGETGIQAILSRLLVLGMLTYSGGGSFGNPVIHFGPVALKDKLEESAEVFRIYGQRMAIKTKEIFD